MVNSAYEMEMLKMKLENIVIITKCFLICAM